MMDQHIAGEAIVDAIAEPITDAVVESAERQIRQKIAGATEDSRLRGQVLVQVVLTVSYSLLAGLAGRARRLDAPDIPLNPVDVFVKCLNDMEAHAREYLLTDLADGETRQ